MRFPLASIVALSFLGVARAQTQPDFTLRLLAFDGVPLVTGGTVADIDSQLSINDAGKIAFSGADSSLVGLFLIENGAVARVVDFQAGFVINGAALNNAPQPLIASRDRMNGSPPVFFIRAWESDGLQNFTVIGRSPDDFDSGQLFVDVNDSGVVAFPALVNQSTETALMAGFVEPPIELERFTGIVNLRPQISNTGMVVTRDASQQIVGYQFPGGAMTPFGQTADGFTLVGRQPGISTDGRTAAFFGVRGQGEGLFVSVKTPGSATGQTLFALAGEGAGTFSDFADDERVGVISTGALPAKVTGSVVVVGTSSGVTGVYVLEFSVTQSGGPPTLSLTDVRRVAKIGDTVTWRNPSNASAPPVSKTLASMQLYDPINRDGSIAFYATFQGGGEGVVLGEGDRDGDGLLDVWETKGIDSNGDGVIDLDLAALGANAFHKTVFVEVDAMLGHAPDPLSLAQVQTVFANAPASLVSNPDLLGGIDLFSFLDETSIPSVPLPNALHDTDAIKAQFFGTPQQRLDPDVIAAKRLAFHYCLFVDTILGNSTTGQAEIPGNDFLVALGHPKWVAHKAAFGQLRVEAGTYMHELGHSLGLLHGGADDRMYKPNYRSVMNYYWQFPNDKNDPFWTLDYSTKAFHALDENALLESQGIGGNPADMVLVGPAPTRLVPEGGAADFNGDGPTANAYAQNVNDIDATEPQPPGETLAPSVDWSILRFDFRNTVDFANGSHFTADQQPEVDGDSIDAIEQSCPAPAVYCTAKVNSLGCAPVASIAGSTSLSGPDDLVVRVDNVLNQRRGVILWSKSSVVQPFGGGFLCVEGPQLRSLPIGSSGGSSLPSNDCTGAYVAPFSHAYMASKGILAGDIVFAQCWSRDNGFAEPDNIGLSQGVAFYVCP